MKTIEIAGSRIEQDDEGFLKDMKQWNREVANSLAGLEGFGSLDDQQFEIICFLRDYYRKFNSFPILGHICRNLGHSRECVNEEFINPMKAWKIAGLPKPDGVQFVAVDGAHYIMQECC